MSERPGGITMKGKPLTLVGQEVKVGDPAPDFSAVANDLSDFRFSSLKGQVCIISAVPSLDTPVCDIETRRFNDEAAGLGAGVKLLTISMDLPFAQKRWCGAAGVENPHDLLGPPGGGLRPGLRGADQGIAPPGPGGVRGG